MSSNMSSTTQSTTQSTTTQSTTTTKKLFMPSSYYTDLNRISNVNSGSGSNSSTIDKRYSRDRDTTTTRDTSLRNRHTTKPDYILYISATRNNTHVHLSNAMNGNTIAQSTAGMLGLKKAARGNY